MITLVVAHGKELEIGLNNELLWHLPADMQHFKQSTTGGTVVMGRKTYESIGRPLPNRENIVLSTSTKHIDGVQVVDSIDSILQMAQDREIFIIGGETVYRAFLPFADRLLITLVEATFKADSYFPEYFDLLYKYRLKETKVHKADKRNAYDMRFWDFRKI